ncbi:MAG TPA: 5'-nucleotidase C-terminal domain-containing protein [Vicinamibacteria bacterium]|nr:5'-nucleotidase C-terminal domain-containing protein [Vicinamibacteria bacterium]
MRGGSTLLLRALLFAAAASAQPATPPPERVTVTVLATTDVHGSIYPYDYYTRETSARGLARDATLIEAVRRETKNTLLVDCGDTIQGSPLESVHQNAVRAGKTRAADPMMLAMDAMGYDAMVVGNHEFNFGLANLQAARESARFPWLSANTVSDGALPPFAPFLVKTVGGVKVAVIGVTTAAVPSWERPETIRGLRFLPQEEGVRRALDALEPEHPDVVVAAVHAGLDRDPQTGARRPGEPPTENRVWEIAEQFPQLAAIVYGHTHQREPGRRVGNVLLVQPKNNGADVARIDLTLVRDGSSRWRLEKAASSLMPIERDTVADPRILEIARPYHEAAERWLDQPVAESAVELSGERGRFEDTALVDAIQEVQLHYAQADVSFTALFRPQARVPRGRVSVRELAGLYVYDNELYVVEGNGRIVREALENAARFFRSCPEPSCATGPLLDRSVFGYNFDMAEGVDYDIDLTRPVGQRIVDLTFRGAPLRDEQPLRIAVNNYRAAGSNGYTMFRDARIVWRSGRDIRDLMVEYFTRTKRLPARADGNWSLLPPQAVETLAREEAVGARPASGTPNGRH